MLVCIDNYQQVIYLLTNQGISGAAFDKITPCKMSVIISFLFQWDELCDGPIFPHLQKKIMNYY